MWNEFKEFALKGNALSLAIGVIIGAAFGKIVDALVNDIIMPILGIAGKADFSNYYVPLSSAVTATNLTDARKQGGVLAYGDFITVVINFLIVAIALFVVIKGINTHDEESGQRAAPAGAAHSGSRSSDPDPRRAGQARRLARLASERSNRYVAASDAASRSGLTRAAPPFRATQKDVCATTPAPRSTRAEASAGLAPKPASATRAAPTAIWIEP